MGAGRPDPNANRNDVIGGWTIEPWAGVNLYDPPHLIGKNEFQRLENSRWDGDSMVPRLGQSKFSPTNPAGGSFFLWGGYGGVLQHGGVGGVGFKDAPGAENPATFPFSTTAFTISSKHGNFIADRTGNYLYAVVLVTVSGIVRLFRVYRIPKQYSGVANMFVLDVSGSFSFYVYNLSTAAATLLGSTTASIAAWIMANGELLTEIPLETTGAGDFSASLLYAENGILWIAASIAIGANQATVFYKLTVGTGELLEVKRYTHQMSVFPRLYKMGTQLVTLCSNPTVYNATDLYVMKVPDFSGAVQVATSAFEIGGIAGIDNLSSVFCSGWSPVLSGVLYLPGHSGTAAVLQQIQADLTTQSTIDLGVAAPGPTANARHTMLRSGLLYTVYLDPGSGEFFKTWNGSALSGASLLGDQIGSPRQIHSDGRMFTVSATPLALLFRSAVDDYVTAFAGFGSPLGGSSLGGTTEIVI